MNFRLDGTTAASLEFDRNLGCRIETFEGPLHDWVRAEVERKQAQKQAGLKGN